MGCQFNTDCEGPISKNDNAMELSEFYIPNGHRLFAIVSKYDDYLADVERRPGYKAGDTLKLILPFLKAFGVRTRGSESSAGTISSLSLRQKRLFAKFVP